MFVYLEDVAPSGEVTILTHGRLRASFRSEQKPPFRNFMGLPYHRGNRGDVKPLTPGERTRARIDLLPAEGPPPAEGRGMDHVCLSIRCDDLQAVAASLRARGVTLDSDVVTRRGAWGDGPSLYIRDPDGYRLELKPRG